MRSWVVLGVFISIEKIRRLESFICEPGVSINPSPSITVAMLLFNGALKIENVGVGLLIETIPDSLNSNDTGFLVGNSKTENFRLIK